MTGAHPPFDANAVRRDFLILNELVRGRPLIWLDNAATTQKPQVAPMDDDGQILLEEYQKLLGSRTRLMAFSQVSNALGTVTPG